MIGSNKKKIAKTQAITNPQAAGKTDMNRTFRLTNVTQLQKKIMSKT